MRVVKFYKVEPTGDGAKKIRVVKAQLSARGWHSQVAKAITTDGRVIYGPSIHRPLAELEDRMFGMGYSRRRPLKPHDFREQRPGYHQPTEQQQRFARQQERKAA